MAVRSITKRWLINSLGVILIILIAVEISFTLIMRSYYYDGVRQALMSRANVMHNTISNMSQSDTASYRATLRENVENFADRDKMECMVVSKDGQVLLTSSGFESAPLNEAPDFVKASLSADGVGEYHGTIGGENIYAVTMVSPYADSQYYAVRYVTSMQNVDNQLLMLIAVITLVCIAIVLFVVYSGSYFIKSIVIPVGEVNKTAARIASGDFDVRLTKQYNDEIGELCDTINYMASEISAAEKMKNEFISSVSHELRTPMTAIKGWGETLLDCGPSDQETLQKGMRVILSETDRLSGMVEELLDFSRMLNGRFSLMLDRLDIYAEVGDAVLMFEERARREGVKILYDQPDDIVVVYADKNRIRQVLVNILDNALKYSDANDTIYINTWVENNFVNIVIRDTGAGIAPEDLANVKNKFYKGKQSRRGSGIGLAVADEIISMHGGTLTLDSVLGEGTTVTIRLPVQNGKRAEEIPTHLPQERKD